MWYSPLLSTICTPKFYPPSHPSYISETTCLFIFSSVSFSGRQNFRGTKDFSVWNPIWDQSCRLCMWNLFSSTPSNCYSVSGFPNLLSAYIIKYVPFWLRIQIVFSLYPCAGGNFHVCACSSVHEDFSQGKHSGS